MRLVKYLVIALLLLITAPVYATCWDDGECTVGGVGADYAKLQSACTAAVSGTKIKITGSTTEADNVATLAATQDSIEIYADTGTDFTIDASGVTDGLIIDGSTGIIVKNLTFTVGTTSGIHVKNSTASNGNMHVTVEGCTFNPTSTGKGVMIGNASADGSTHTDWADGNYSFVTIDHCIFNQIGALSVQQNTIHDDLTSTLTMNDSYLKGHASSTTALTTINFGNSVISRCRFERVNDNATAVVVFVRGSSHIFTNNYVKNASTTALSIGVNLGALAQTTGYLIGNIFEGKGITTASSRAIGVSNSSVLYSVNNLIYNWYYAYYGTGGSQQYFSFNNIFDTLKLIESYGAVESTAVQTRTNNCYKDIAGDAGYTYSAETYSLNGVTPGDTDIAADIVAGTSIAITSPAVVGYISASDFTKYSSLKSSSALLAKGTNMATINLGAVPNSIINTATLIERNTDFDATAADMFVNVGTPPTWPMGPWVYRNAFYVKNTAGSAGVDTNAGTSGNPILTVAQAVKLALNPSDTIYFNKGDTWREQLSVPASGDPSYGNITYKGYGAGAKPVIESYYDLSATGSWTDHGGNIWYAAAALDVGALSYGSDTVLPAKKVWNTNIATTLSTTAGNFYHDTAEHEGHGVALYVYSTSNPATAYSGLKAWHQANNTALATIGLDTKDYITIDGLAIKYSGAHGINVWNSSNNTITNCDISYCGGAYVSGSTRFGAGIQVNADTGKTATGNNITNNTVSQIFDVGIGNEGSGDVSNTTVTGNTISYCGGGIQSWVGGATDWTGIDYSKNTISYSGSGWSTTSYTAQGGIGGNFYNSSTGTQTYNISQNIFDHDVESVRIRGGGTATFSNNVVRNATGTSGGIYLSYMSAKNDSTVDFTGYGNLIYNNDGPGILISHDGATKLYNNTFYLNGKPGTSTSNFYIAAGLSDGVVTMANNIVYSTDGTGAAGDSIPFKNMDSPATIASSTNNCFYRPATDTLIHSDTLTPTTYILTAFGDYQTNSSKETNSVAADPKFKNASAGQFWVKCSSPCASAGTDTSVCEQLLDPKSTFGAGGTVKTILQPQSNIAIGCYSTPKHSLFPVLPIWATGWCK